MEIKKDIQKTIGGIAVFGAIVGGIFTLSRDTQEQEIKQMRAGLVEKVENKDISYFEYLHLANEYNIEVQKLNEKGEMLNSANKNGTITEILNNKLLE